ncbi:hypothetical protein ACIBQX_11500 [Nonomuraea sp. NPDC049714]|uniref:hypothetical protein n=1 Tax=Nonomuraea sp. NPDC049714 TaxID=3364357 RepID=UPI0037BD02FD
MPPDRGTELGALRTALRKVAIAGVTVKKSTQGSNEIYHLLNSELKPLCGSGDTFEGRFLMAVTAPWILRCTRVGCRTHWGYITEAGEVIATKQGELYHYDVRCTEFKEGHRIHARAGDHQRDVVQMSYYTAEKAGKSPCTSCVL